MNDETQIIVSSKEVLGYKIRLVQAIGNKYRPFKILTSIPVPKYHDDRITESWDCESLRDAQLVYAFLDEKIVERLKESIACCKVGDELYDQVRHTIIALQIADANKVRQEIEAQQPKKKWL